MEFQKIWKFIHLNLWKICKNRFFTYTHCPKLKKHSIGMSRKPEGIKRWLNQTKPNQTCYKVVVSKSKKIDYFRRYFWENPNFPDWRFYFFLAKFIRYDVKNFTFLMLLFLLYKMTLLDFESMRYHHQLYFFKSEPGYYFF